MPNLLFCDSFSHYDTTALPLKYSAGSTFDVAHQTIVPGAGRLAGSGCFRVLFNGLGGYILLRQLGASSATLCLEAAIKSTAQPTLDSPILSIAHTLGIAAELQWTTTNALKLLLHNVPVVTSGAVLTANSWYHISMKIFMHATAGTVQVWVNSAQMINFSGDTTGAGTALAVNAFRLGHVQMTGAGPATTDWSDLTCTDDEINGDCYVKAIFPDGPGTYSEWAPSADTPWECVNDPQMNSDIDYVATGQAGFRSSYHVQPLTLEGTIKGVQQVSTMRKDEALARTARQFVRMAGTDYEGNVSALNLTWGMYLRPMSVSPAGSAWTKSLLNASEPGTILVS